MYVVIYDDIASSSFQKILVDRLIDDVDKIKNKIKIDVLQMSVHPDDVYDQNTCVPSNNIKHVFLI